jgi:predicted ATP-dependent endonuclease of OLD family/5S rRNA maturation endonuclease (ribonuclease M5)
MKHKFFSIKDFKGIEKVRIDFDSHPQSSVYTLVGLNESGKTTILEALNFFHYKSESLDPLNLHGYSVNDVHELIPISKRSNFNDTISIRVGFVFDDEDNKKLRKFLKDELSFELSKDIPEMEIEQKYAFEDSKLISKHSQKIWYVHFKGKTKRGKVEKYLKDQDWQKATDFLIPLLPSILFFPNFLFEFPDKIYLENKAEDTNEDSTKDSEKHEFYRTVLQDVLDAIGKNHKLQRHILDRANSIDRNDHRALDSVLLEMGAHITQTVFSNWNRIFKRKIGKKEIIVRCDKDDDGRWYLQLRLRDANEQYSISERSLGFRWFFTFLLLTQYRGFRSGDERNILFLFDEPASNLHPSAQSQLLESFGKFPSNASIMYTTHSHHMINPDWLEGTFVVRNEGLDYEDEDNYSAKKTNVTLQKYRSFAITHPNQTTYFQPILDVLDYSPGKLENIPNVVMVEGKNDFYTLKYFQDVVFKRSLNVNLMPGTGSGSLDTVIRLYLAWGRSFIILLDSDSAGVKEKKRYEENFGSFVKNRIFLLKDIEPSWNKEMESLVEKPDVISIQSLAYPSALKFNKTHFNRAIQELYLTNKMPTISQATKDNFKKLLEFCEQKLKV